MCSKQAYTDSLSLSEKEEITKFEVWVWELVSDLTLWVQLGSFHFMAVENNNWGIKFVIQIKIWGSFFYVWIYTYILYPNIYICELIFIQWESHYCSDYDCHLQLTVIYNCTFLFLLLSLSLLLQHMSRVWSEADKRQRKWNYINQVNKNSLCNPKCNKSVTPILKRVR